MNDSIVRYQFDPLLTDTVGFFDYCIPLTNEASHPAADSNLKFYDFSIYNYITPLPPPKALISTRSVFAPHTLSPIHKGPLAITRQPMDWITIVFIGCLLVFAWLQTFYSKRMKQIFQAVAQRHHLNQLEREGNIFKERISLGLGFVYYTMSAIFVFLIFREYGNAPSGWSNLALTAVIFTGILVYQVLKSFVVYLTGVIFETQEVARQYQLNILIFNFLIGIVLFPLVLMIFYWNSSFLLITGIVITTLLLLYRFFRGILAGATNKSYNLLYLFLYLCTLEILPMLLLYKVVTKM